MGSNAPVGETVSTAGRRGMIAVDGRERQKGFSGRKSRLAVIVGCSRPLRARDRGFFDGSYGALAAADGQAVRCPGRVIVLPFLLLLRRISLPEGALCILRRAGAGCA